jgi:hypothetical protein
MSDAVAAAETVARYEKMMASLIASNAEHSAVLQELKEGRDKRPVAVVDLAEQAPRKRLKVAPAVLKLRRASGKFMRASVFASGAGVCCVLLAVSRGVFLCLMVCLHCLRC